MKGLEITNDQLVLGRVLLYDRHGLRCKRAAILVARALGITDDHLLDELAEGARMHDVGKAWVPPWVVDKAGAFDPEERLLMQLHPEKGEEFLIRLGVNGELRQIVRSHHERWDGKGYPDGLAGVKIPVLARIIAPIDTYDALRSPRNYPRYDSDGKRLKEGGEFDHDAAMRIVVGGSGNAFDPRVVKVFRRMKDREFR